MTNFANLASRHTSHESQVAPSSLYSHSEVLLEVMDSLGMGVILANHLGHVFYINRVAADAIRRKSAIRLNGDGIITATSLSETADLRKLIQKILSAPEGATGYISIKDKLFQTCLNVSVARLQGGGSPCVAIYFIDHEVGKVVPAHAVQKLFGLTRREAELASALAGGVRIAEYAIKQNVSLHTVNTQLKSIKAKTNATSQSDLVRILVRSFPVLLDDRTLEVA